MHNYFNQVSKLKYVRFQIKFTDTTRGTGMATAGVFQYFFWVLLQPFRGYPTYKDVAIESYNGTCLGKIDKSQTDMKELG